MRNADLLKKYILAHLPCKCNIKGAKSVKDYKVKSLKTAIVTDIDNNTAICTLVQSVNLEQNQFSIFAPMPYTTVGAGGSVRAIMSLEHVEFVSSTNHGLFPGFLYTISGGAFMFPASFKITSVENNIPEFGVVSSGDYSLLPPTQNIIPTTKIGSGNITVNISFKIDKIKVERPGIKYCDPILSFSHGNVETKTKLENGYLRDVEIISGGSGFKTSPDITVKPGPIWDYVTAFKGRHIVVRNKTVSL